MRAARIVIAIVVVLALAGAAFWWWQRSTPPPPPPPEARVETPPAAPAGPKYPVTPDTAAPLPALNASDPAMNDALSDLVGAQAVQRFLNIDGIVRNIVATVDNLPREEVSQRVSPLRPAPGLPVISGKGPSLTLAPANAARYAPQVRLLETVPTESLVAFYRRNYPLFQQAYVELGYPDGYFNDRLVEVIDHLLAAPEPTGPLRLKQPKVLYEFADPDLEELSAGQKAMLRIGKENRERVKAKLREIRSSITAR
jgi:hypothetical protein